MREDAAEIYADIIHLPHPVSRRHPQMSMADRAAQFSPFAALTGHDAAIAEAARLTDERPILDESVKQEISNLLQLAATDSNLVLNIVYFVPATRQLRGDHRAHQEAYTARKVPYHGHRHPHPGGGDHGDFYE